MDLIIFSGQSNMQGQTECLPYNNSAVNDAFEYNFADDLLIPLRHPVGENLDINGRPFCPDFNDIPGTIEKSALLASWENHANMVPEFCRSYIAVTGDQVAAVHAAKGSTTIDYWLKGNLGYNFLYQKSVAAIKKVNPHHIFFVWLQGESDAIAGASKECYKEKLLQLNRDLQKDLHIEKFGIILVGRFTGDERDDCIIHAQKEICTENKDFLMLTTITEQMTQIKKFMNPFADGHYNCQGQEIIGAFAGHALGIYRLSQK